MKLIKPFWGNNRHAIVQKVVVGHKMVSILPEVTRSAHIRSRNITNLGSVPPRDVFESQLLNGMTHPRWNLSILTKEGRVLVCGTRGREIESRQGHPCLSFYFILYILITVVNVEI